MKNWLKYSGGFLKSMAFCMALVICVTCLCGAASYRRVKVIGYEGDVNITRGNETFSVYDGLLIQTGDEMETSKKGEAHLQLDDDKYMVVESSTKLSFELKGNAKKGAIRINLQKGAVYNTIENPLEKEDSYEIVTPDGVMAVRGTKFYVRVAESEDGTYRMTYVAVLDGKVYVRLDTGDYVQLDAGLQAVIRGDTDSEYCYFTEAGRMIDPEELPDSLREEAERIVSEIQARQAAPDGNRADREAEPAGQRSSGGTAPTRRRSSEGGVVQIVPQSEEPQPESQPEEEPQTESQPEPQPEKAESEESESEEPESEEPEPEEPESEESEPEEPESEEEQVEEEQDEEKQDEEKQDEVNTNTPTVPRRTSGRSGRTNPVQNEGNTDLGQAQETDSSTSDVPEKESSPEEDPEEEQPGSDDSAGDSSSESSGGDVPSDSTSIQSEKEQGASDGTPVQEENSDGLNDNVSDSAVI